MPDLEHSLASHDLGHLRIVAELWGISLSVNEAESARQELVAALLEPRLVREIVESLPDEARRGLQSLLENEGRLPWVAFVRRFGQIREMGPGRRDREHPQRQPVSVAEMLFYRALLARAFFDTPNGPQEFAYLPDDLLPLIEISIPEEIPQENASRPTTPELLGRPATPAEKAVIIPSSDRILDDTCTLLAALRMGIQLPSLAIAPAFLLELLQASGVLADSVPQPEPVKSLLEAAPGQALRQLYDSWLASERLNELRQLPDLVFEGEWTNQPRVTREFLLGLLEALPQGKWWSLPALVRAIKEQIPDFQRPAGDYDSWFIKRADDGTYLRGFAHWEAIDGALVRYLICGPIFWLGRVDLAAPETGAEPTAFRLRDSAPTSDENGKLHATSQGKLLVPQTVPRAVRYQIARFCEWQDPKGDDYRYRLTPQSLKHAQEQGLKVEHLLALLAKHGSGGPPPSLIKALRRWELNGTEARVEHPVVLRVSSPEVLNELRKSKAGRFLSEPLGPTAVIVKSGAQAKILAALAELGFLAEDETNGDIMASDKPHE